MRRGRCLFLTIWGVDTLKEKIYNIPLTDAFAEDSECPFCVLERKLEEEAVEYALGASMMEPDSRVVSNEKGFCRRHFTMMGNLSKALPLGLVLDTHLDHVVKQLEAAAQTQPARGMFKKANSAREEMLAVFNKVNESCAICDKINGTLSKFAQTFWMMLAAENDFREKVLAGKGFCLPHFALLLETAPLELSGSKLERFTGEVAKLELDNLKRVGEDVNWFTKKFDYRNQDAPWKTSKDALPRTMEKLAKFQP